MHLKFEQKALIEQVSFAFEKKAVQTATYNKTDVLNLMSQFIVCVCVCGCLWKSHGHPLSGGGGVKQVIYNFSRLGFLIKNDGSYLLTLLMP